MVPEVQNEISDRSFISDFRSDQDYLSDAAHPSDAEAYLVLDGQQRMQSLYLSFFGSYDGARAYMAIDHVPAPETGDDDYDFLAEDSLGRRLVTTTIEHLTLVVPSLLAAVLVAVPLGVLAARRPALGRGILAASGVLQTIPSLALLLFMIPVMMWLVGRGTGTPPAVAALFLYSLLPIVRNTHAGIKGISESLRESAEALGLPQWAILWRIELPLAAPTILAGVKTAAVINVGTATLGGFIGAGGYGRPILRGIDKFDIPLMLEGAIPAALLALAVEALFDLTERMIARRA